MVVWLYFYFCFCLFVCVVKGYRYNYLGLELFPLDFQGLYSNSVLCVLFYLFLLK